MDRMRQEATEKDLDFQLEKSLVMFASIKTGLVLYLHLIQIYR